MSSAESPPCSSRHTGEEAKASTVDGDGEGDGASEAPPDASEDPDDSEAAGEATEEDAEETTEAVAAEAPEEVAAEETAEEDAVAAPTGAQQLLEDALALRGIRPELWDPDQPPNALLECMMADAPDHDLVVRLLRQPKVDKNMKEDTFGWSPILFACHRGDVKIMNALLKAKADAAAHCKNSNGMLHLAARGGHTDAVNFLISRGSDLEEQNENGWTPLAWTAQRGHAAVAGALIDAGAAIDAPDAAGRTPGMWAARHGHAAVLQALLAEGVDLDHRDEQGWTVADHGHEHLEMRMALLEAEAANDALLAAAQANDVAAARRALERGASANSLDDSGWGALTWSMLHHSVDLVQLLARRSADPEAVAQSAELLGEVDLGGPEVREELDEAFAEGLASRGRLMRAARDGDWRTVEAELAAGASVNAREDGSRMTCLMLAAIHGELDALSSVMTMKAKPDQHDALGWTAVHFAVQTGRTRVVALLHHLKVDLSMPTIEGQTGQHLAAKGDDAVMVRLLAKGRCSVNAETCLGATPLQEATRWGSVAAFKALVARGADTLKRDAEGRSLLALAAVHGHAAVAQAALEPSAELSEPGPNDDEGVEVLDDGDERFALLYAPYPAPKKKPRDRGNSEEEPESDQPAPADPLMGDNEGRLPLALAAAAGQLDVLELLLERKCPVDTVDEAGSTALILAAAAGHRAVVERLLAVGARPGIRNKAGFNAERATEDPGLRSILQRPRGKGGGRPPSQPAPSTGEGLAEAARVFRLRLERLQFLLSPEDMEAQARKALSGPLGSKRAGTVPVSVPLHPIFQCPLGYAYADFEEEAEARRVWRSRNCKLDGVMVRVVLEGSRPAAPPETEGVPC